MAEPAVGLNTVVLDTDVASLLFKERLDATSLGKIYGRHTILTFVTVGEMTAWTEIRSWGPQCTETLTAWLDETVVLPGDEAVAAIWGRLRAAGRRHGVATPVNDTWIAACCLSYGLPLATLNVKDYEYFQTRHGLVVL